MNNMANIYIICFSSHKLQINYYRIIIMRKILLSSILAMYSVSVSAVIMEEALTSGYNHNEDF